MKLFELLFGNLRKFVAAEEADHAKAIGEDPEVSPDLHFRPFEVIEIQVEGFEITVNPVEVDATAEPVTEPTGEPQEPSEPVQGDVEPQTTQEPANEPAGEPEPPVEPTSTQGEPADGTTKTVEEMDRDELKAWLDERNIEYVPQWGEKRLRELVLHHLEKLGE